MLFCCSKCGKFRKYGEWVDVPQRLLTQIQKVPISYMLCLDCGKEVVIPQPFACTDGGGIHKPFAKRKRNHKKECCRSNNGSKAHTAGRTLCACGSH